MKGKHLNQMRAFSFFAQKKFIVAIVVFAISLLLVPGIVHAAESNNDTPANDFSVTISVTENDGTTPVTANPFVYVIGTDKSGLQIMFCSGFVTDNVDGVFTINLPDEVKGVLFVAGADNHEVTFGIKDITKPKPIKLDAKLNAGNTFNLKHNAALYNVKMLGSSTIGLPGGVLQLPELQLRHSFFPSLYNNGDNAKLETKENGIFTWSVKANADVNFDFQVEPVSGYHFQTWDLVNYDEASSNAQVVKTLIPIIAKDGEIIIFGTLHSHRSEPFSEDSHPYVACVGVRNSILDPIFYIGDVVNIPAVAGQADASYSISVPSDFVIGSLIFGGNQYKNHAVNVAPDISTKVDAEISPGRTFTIEHGEGFHYIALKAGSTFHAELAGFDIMDYTFDEDYPFYGMGLPYYGFNATQVDPVEFKEDGTANFKFDEEEAGIYSINANITLQAVPAEGYVFDKWEIEKYDDPENELIPVYDFKKLTPVFKKVLEPEYVDAPQTGDYSSSLIALFVLMLGASAFGFVFGNRIRRIKHPIHVK